MAVSFKLRSSRWMSALSASGQHKLLKISVCFAESFRECESAAGVLQMIDYFLKFQHDNIHLEL
jgi:hypothetical protein